MTDKPDARPAIRCPVCRSTAKLTHQTETANIYRCPSCGTATPRVRAQPEPTLPLGQAGEPQTRISAGLTARDHERRVMESLADWRRLAIEAQAAETIYREAVRKAALSKLVQGNRLSEITGYTPARISQIKKRKR